MNFATNEFLLLFLPGALIAVLVLQERLSRDALCGLVFALSSVFYITHSPALYVLLLGSILVNYLLARRIDRPGATLAAGVVFNLGLLFLFKYADFFAGAAGLTPIGFVLPLAISFYTFQQVSFLVDRARGRTPDYPSLPVYAAYVSFFPQLIAGPIVRFGQVSRRLMGRTPFRVSAASVRLGAPWLAVGLFKKVVLADTLALPADAAFAQPESLTFLDAWLGTLAFGLQIYFDFSAYSDIAVGCALMFGLRLPDNFKRPYLATSIRDFWRRWHITLSRFLRDYLYIPLGGRRVGPSRRLVNLMIVMILGGLWHGANWTFLLWGALHGLYLVVATLWRRVAPAPPAVVGWALTMLAVTIAWAPFRADSIEDALTVWAAMAGAGGLALPPSAAALAQALGLPATTAPMTVFNLPNLALVAAACLVVALAPSTRAFALLRRGVVLQALSAGALAAAAVVLMQGGGDRFIYFVF